MRGYGQIANLSLSPTPLFEMMKHNSKLKYYIRTQHNINWIKKIKEKEKKNENSKLHVIMVTCANFSILPTLSPSIKSFLN
jgi:hypothetical protein